MSWHGGEGIDGGSSGGDSAGGAATTGAATTSTAAGSGTPAVTSTTTEVTVAPIPVDILEFDDDLFHDDSVVMMPEIPSAADADSASGSGDAEEPFTGVKALGLGLIMARLYPERGMLVTGHTAGGNVEESFQLSRNRAAVVLALFQGQAGEFGTRCAEKHTVEDYKQILKYVNDLEADWKSGDWDCGPGTVDNTFNDATQTALNHFAVHFNSDLASSDDDSDTDAAAGAAEATATAVSAGHIDELPETLGEIVSGATDNMLSAAHWTAIYHLYNRLVCDFVGCTVEELEELRGRLHWVNDGVKMVGCAHSYAVPSGERADDKIRSESDSRIEVLFYRASAQESNALNVCGTLPTASLHDLEDDCPMWHERHFTRSYVGNGDRFAVVYHLKFRYYDRIKKDFQDIPGRVNVKAYKRAEAAGSAVEDIPCITQYQDGMHTVRVRFGEENPNFTNKLFFFGFEAPMTTATASTPAAPIVRMIRTTGPDATPRIVNRPGDTEWNALSFAEKFQYYDLPMKWYSHNYYTRHESTPANDDRFHEHIKDRRQLKPFGGNVTSLSEPLMFSLDDMVLVDDPTNHSQALQDANQRGTAKALCDGGANPGSRVKILVVDDTTQQLKLWQKPDNDKTSENRPPASGGTGSGSSAGSAITTARRERVRLERNLITGMAPNPKLIHFRDNFYFVSDLRTTDRPTNWMDLSHKPVVGARRAVRDDANRHLKWERHVFNNEYGFTGDYELHLFPGMNVDGNHPVAYMMVYAAMNFMMDTRGAASSTTEADLRNFVNEGVYNCTDRWNKKGFFYDEETSGDTTIIIRPCYLFDERETFHVAPADLPHNKDFEVSSQVPLRQICTCTAFRDAQTAAFGGRVKFVAFIGPDNQSAWAWATRGTSTTHSAMLLCKPSYHDINGPWPFNSTGGYTEDGDAYGFLTFAHELGHVTGCQDEYINKKTILGTRYPGFTPHLLQYTMDPNNEAAMMFHNAAPRLRHLWYHLHYMNSQTSGLPASHPLKDKRFVLRRHTGSIDHTYKRHVGWRPAGTPTPPPAGTPEVKGDIRQPVMSDNQSELPDFVSVSVTPNLTTLDAALNAKLRFENTGRLLFWTGTGAMTATERDAIRAVFASAADQDKITTLYHKTRCMTRLRLALFDVGQDESSEGPTSSKGCFHTDQNNFSYQGVLVVRVMLGIAAGTPAMSNADITTRLGAILNAWLGMRKKFRLTGGPTELANVYVHFMPGFEVQASAGSDWNYALSFITTYEETVSSAPDLTTLSAACRAATSYNSTSHKLSYNGAMTEAHRTELRGLFTSAADKTRVDSLFDKTNLISADGRITVASSVTANQLKARFLNMEDGGDELEAAKFLELWINQRLSASYTLQSITTSSSAPTGGTGSP